MKITNKNNRPLALVAAVEASFNRDYTPGADHYVTQLVQPTRVVVLREKYDAEREIDIDDAIHILRGLAIAHVLEVAGKNLPPGTGEYEKRYETTLNVDGDPVRISCRLDALERGILYDYKDTSVFAVAKGIKSDWQHQLESEFVILTDNGVPVNGMAICALLKDFRPSEARRKPEMPQKPIHEVRFDLPLYELAAGWMVDKIREIRAAREAMARGDEPPECSQEEMWVEPEAWAVRKKGGTRAISGGVQLSQAAAEAVVAAQKKPGDYEIEHRPYIPKRCIGHCDVSRWCSQFQAYKAAVGGKVPEAEGDA